jgi:hypothetical protein
VAQARNPETSGGKAARFEERDGALLALGLVLAQCLTPEVGPHVPPQAMQAAALALFEALSDRTSQLGATAALALAYAALRGELPLQLEPEEEVRGG